MSHPNDDLQKSDMDYLRIAADAGDPLARAVLLVEQADLIMHTQVPRIETDHHSATPHEMVFDLYVKLSNEWMRRNGR